MKKIPTLFLRRREFYEIGMAGPNDYEVMNQVRPGCEWVLDGKGIATRMWDGTCCLVKDGKLWKRYHSKDVRNLDVDTSAGITAQWIGTHEWLGWIPVTDAPEDKWHREAWDDLAYVMWENDLEARRYGGKGSEELYGGTYELCGPKINGNPEGFDKHELIRHGEERVLGGWVNGNTSSDLIHQCLRDSPGFEGIVWWHKDDKYLPYHERRLAKIKRKDFCLEWPIK